MDVIGSASLVDDWVAPSMTRGVIIEKTHLDHVGLSFRLHGRMKIGEEPHGQGCWGGRESHYVITCKTTISSIFFRELWEDEAQMQRFSKDHLRQSKTQKCQWSWFIVWTMTFSNVSDVGLIWMPRQSNKTKRTNTLRELPKPHTSVNNRSLMVRRISEQSHEGRR